MSDDLNRLVRAWQSLSQASQPSRAKPLVTLDRTRLTDDELWMLWRDGFDVSAELERRYGL